MGNASTNFEEEPSNHLVEEDKVQYLQLSPYWNDVSVLAAFLVAKYSGVSHSVEHISYHLLAHVLHLGHPFDFV